MTVAVDEILKLVTEFSRSCFTPKGWNHNNTDGNGYAGALVLMEDLVEGIRLSLKKS